MCKLFSCFLTVIGGLLLHVSSDFTLKNSKNGTQYQVLIENIPVPSNETPNHQYLILNNGLQVMVISDPTIKRSSLSLALQVGTKSDPIPGLASLAAQTIFTGCKKYLPGEFLIFLRENWGYVDPTVHYEHTIFNMMLDNDALEDGLEYFSQSIINPIFPISGIDWVLNDGSNEFERYSRSDVARAEQVQRNLSDSSHPFSAPNIGLKEKLKERFLKSEISLQQELIDFSLRYYSSNLMKLAILGKDPLDKLVESTIEKFSLILNKNLPKPIYHGVPYKREHLSKKIIVNPIKSTRTLDLQFLLPGIEDSTSFIYIEYILSHEGKSTFNYYLKELGYATTILNRITKRFAEFAIYEISINLTPLGEIHHNEIAGLLFKYIDLIKEKGITLEFYNEIQRLKNLRLEFQEKLWPVEITKSLVTFMLRPISPELLLKASSQLGSFTPEIIKSILNNFNIENLRIIFISEHVKNQNDTQTEPTLGGVFSVEPITNEHNLPHLVLQIPNLNEFISEDFKITKYNFKNPKKLEKRRNGILWYYPGNFSIPRSSIRLGFFNDVAHDSVKSAVCLEILKEILRYSFRDILFSSRSAGIEFNIETTHNAIVIVLNGYNQHSTKVVKQLMERLIQYDISEINFLTAVSEVFKDLNPQKISSVAQVSQLTVYGMLEHNWSKVQKSNKLSEINVLEMQNFSRLFFSNSYVEYLITGNLSPEVANSSFNDIINILNNNGVQIHTALRGIALPNKSLIHRVPVLDSRIQQSAIEFYIDTYSYSNLTSRVFTELTSYLINEPALDVFSNKEKLSSISVTGKFSFAGRGGLRVIMMTYLDPEFVERRIEFFLTEFVESIISMKNDTFNSQLEGFLISKQESPTSLNQAASRIWDQIISESYDFESNFKVINFIKSITRENLYHFLQQNILKNSPVRRKVSFQVVALKYWSQPEIIQLPIPEHLKNRPETEPPQPTASPSIPVPSILTPAEMIIYDLDEWKKSQGLSTFPDLPLDLE